MGHAQGAKVFGKIVRYANKIGIQHLTVYAFSTENWKRSQEEISQIMSLLRSYLKDVDRHREENIRVKILGDISALEGDIQEMIENLERLSGSNTGLNLNIAINYGGQSEILRATSLIARDVQKGVIDPQKIDKSTFGKYLYTAGQPDVDLVIRTSGENRISNFLLWQSAYAEYVFSDVLWPDFGHKDFDLALKEFAARSRRIGGEQ